MTPGKGWFGDDRRDVERGGYEDVISVINVINVIDVIDVMNVIIVIIHFLSGWKEGFRALETRF